MSTILVVDDQSINRKFLAVLLNCAGHRVIEAADGAAALAAMSEQRPDLVISDVLMPTMDGLEFAQRMHDDPSLAETPLIFYTATFRIDDVKEMGARCGVARVLSKPSEPELILAAVDDALASVGRAPPDRRADPEIAAIGARFPDYLHDLSTLQERLRRALEQGLELVGETGPLRKASDYLVESFDTVQTLSLRLAALLELGLVLSSQRHAQKLLDMFCRGAHGIVNTAITALGILDRAGTGLALWAAQGIAPDMMSRFATLDPQSGLLGRALDSGRPQVVARVDDPAGVGLFAGHPAFANFLAVPIRSATTTFGWFYIADRRDGRAFDEQDVQFAVTLAAQLALAYGNLAQCDEIQRHAGELQIEILERRAMAESLRESEALLRESERRFRELAEHIHQAFFLTDGDNSEVLYVSPAYELIWGRSCASLRADPASWAEAIHPEDRERVLATDLPVTRGTPFNHEYRIVRPDGAVRWINARGFPVRDDSGKVYRIAVTAEDITERKDQEQKIARLSRIRAVIGAISSAMLRLDDRDALLTEACRVAVVEGVFPAAWVSVAVANSDQFEIIAGYGNEPDTIEFIAAVLRSSIPVSDRPTYRAARNARPDVVNDLSKDATLGPIREELLRRRFRSGVALPLIVDKKVAAVLVLLASEVGFFDEEEMALLEWLARDLSLALEHLSNAQRLAHLSLYDALTELPNTYLFRDRLDQLIHAAESERERVCVVVIDLERFTHLNDTLGRGVGDDVLRQVASRLSRALIEPYTLGRIGSDTFAAASPREDGDIATRLRDLMLDALAAPIQVQGSTIHLTAQAGIALYPEDGADGATVFKNAESALKLAKSRGTRYAYYSSETSARITERVALEEQLRLALEGGQFVLHYQPRVDMTSGDLVGGEALIRWQHPERGLVSPVEFIGLAEQSGLIVPLGAWVLDAVCAQQSAWLAAGLSVVPIAVNLSSIQFEQGNLLETVTGALSAHRLPAAHLEVELTESAVMSDPEGAAATLHALRRIGVGLALDDFGTGYSSLAHLKRFPFNAVKIDRSFIIDLTSNPEDAAIATAIISMAHRLNLKVIAEGVENQGQFNYLRAHDCDQMQGYCFSPAVPAAEFELLLRSGRRMEMPAPEAKDQRTLLVVDDEPGIRAALTRVLRRDGYRILTAASGPEGLEAMSMNAVQVIISDQRMPGMSGTAFLDTVKQLYPDTVRIILSGYTDLAVVTESVNRGAVFKFLTKPWDDEQLREQVRDAFRRHRAAPAADDPASAGHASA